MLLLVNVPVAALAMVGIGRGIPADRSADLHDDPIDVAGAVLGTATVVLALVAPTLFVESGVRSPAAWGATVGAVVAAAAFVRRQRRAVHPLLDLRLVARPLVSAGLAYKAASGAAVAGLGYLVTLQLQLDWGWSPALAAIGMAPQVLVLVAGGPLVTWFTGQVGLDRAASWSATAVVAGLAVYACLGRFGYPWVALALVLEAAGMRVVGVVAGVNVLKGLPQDRTSIGSALVDTASQVTTAVAVAVTGTVMAALVTGSITAGHWSAAQTGQFRTAVTVAGLLLALGCAALAVWARARARGGDRTPLGVCE